MAGKIKATIEQIIKQRSKGDPVIALTTKTKIILKGINPDKFSATSEDNPQVLESLRKIATELGVSV